MCTRSIAMLLGSVLLAVTATGASAQGSDVWVNGQQLSVAEVYTLQRELGSYVSSGSYLYDEASRCWYNQSTGDRGCLSADQPDLSRRRNG